MILLKKTALTNRKKHHENQNQYKTIAKALHGPRPLRGRCPKGVVLDGINGEHNAFNSFLHHYLAHLPSVRALSSSTRPLHRHCRLHQRYFAHLSSAHAITPFARTSSPSDLLPKKKRPFMDRFVVIKAAPPYQHRHRRNTACADVITPPLCLNDNIITTPTTSGIVN